MMELYQEFKSMWEVTMAHIKPLLILIIHTLLIFWHDDMKHSCATIVRHSLYFVLHGPSCTYFSIINTVQTYQRRKRYDYNRSIKDYESMGVNADDERVINYTSWSSFKMIVWNSQARCI